MLDLVASRLLAAALLILLTIAFLRLLFILPASRPRAPRPRTTPAHLLIVLGSGGHTAEIFSLIRDLNPKRYTQRTYVISSGDSFSAFKAIEFERGLKGKTGREESEEIAPENALLQRDYIIVTVPRARRIHQSLWTTPWSSLLCLLVCVKLFAGYPPKPTGTQSEAWPTKYTSPDLILTNGPATGVIVVIASLVVRYFGLQRGGQMRTVFVESWARVKTLSISGNILLYLALTDRFFVQWEALKGGRKEWRGFLVN